MQKPIIETIRIYHGLTVIDTKNIVVGYERVNRLGFSKMKNSRPKKYSRKII